MLRILSTMVSVYTATTAASSTTAISNIMVDGVDISEFEFDDDSSRSSVQSLLTQLGGAIPVDGAGAGVPEEVGSNKDDSSGNLEVISVLSLVTQEDQVAEDQDQVDGDQEDAEEVVEEENDEEPSGGSVGTSTSSEISVITLETLAQQEDDAGDQTSISAVLREFLGVGNKRQRLN